MCKLLPDSNHLIIHLQQLLSVCAISTLSRVNKKTLHLIALRQHAYLKSNKTFFSRCLLLMHEKSFRHIYNRTQIESA